MNDDLEPQNNVHNLTELVRGWNFGLKDINGEEIMIGDKYHIMYFDEKTLKFKPLGGYEGKYGVGRFKPKVDEVKFVKFLNTVQVSLPSCFKKI